MLKNILAVVVGFFTVFVLSLGTDIVLSYLGILPPTGRPDLYTDSMYFFVMVYCSLFTILGGYITAKLSANNYMRQVYILAFLGLAAGSFGAYANWDKATGHEWFPVVLAITGPIFVIIGGKFFSKNYRNRKAK